MTNDSPECEIFLGGTCNGSDWRGRMMTALDTVSLSYFDPTTDDWNAAAREAERRAREQCRFCVYTITPLMVGVFSIAEVVDDSNKRPDATVFVMLREDQGQAFEAWQWRSLKAVGDMVAANGGQVFESIDSAVNWMASVDAVVD